jgi:hypothetical protein
MFHDLVHNYRTDVETPVCTPITFTPKLSFPGGIYIAATGAAIGTGLAFKSISSAKDYAAKQKPKQDSR